MASRTVKIGPQSMAGIKPGEVLFDTELKRFGARGGIRGGTYFVIPRVDGRQRWITIGRHGPLTPAEARAKARQLLAEADMGGDPTHERDAGKRRPLFAEFAEAWLKSHVEIKRKPNTAREYRRIVEHNLNPTLGKVRVDRITRADAVNLHADMAGSRYVGNRALAVLSAIMSHAERLGYWPQYSNPARGVERFKERKRKRPLSMAEIGALWRHLNTVSETLNPYIVAAFRLLLLTGMRREEVLTLEWEHIDLDAGLIRLADAKTGPRDVVLSKKAVEVLAAIPRIDGNRYVLPGHKHGHRLVNITDRWQEIRVALGFPDVRIHDLRHTVASVLARSAPLIVVRDALGHSEIGTTSGYSHAANDDVRAAVDGLALAIAGPR
jgi:integrase